MKLPVVSGIVNITSTCLPVIFRKMAVQCCGANFRSTSRGSVGKASTATHRPQGPPISQNMMKANPIAMAAEMTHHCLPVIVCGIPL